MKKIKDLGYDEAFIERQKELMRAEVRAAMATRKARPAQKGSAKGQKKSRQATRPESGRSKNVEKE